MAHHCADDSGPEQGRNHDDDKQPPTLVGVERAHVVEIHVLFGCIGRWPYPFQTILRPKRASFRAISCPLS